MESVTNKLSMPAVAAVCARITLRSRSVPTSNGRSGLPAYQALPCDSPGLSDIGGSRIRVPNGGPKDELDEG